MFKRLSDLIYEKLDLLETVFSVAVAVSLFVMIKQWKFWNIALWISFLALATVYFLVSLKKNENETFLENFFNRIYWLSLVTILLGILDKLTNLDAKNTLLIAGLVSLAVSLVLYAFLSLKNKTKTRISLWIRAVIFFAISSLVLTF